MRVTIYPNMPVSDGKGNPYIKDFISALENNGWVIANKPHKNPLVSLFFKKRNSDVYILHWIENVPDYKYGYLQSMIAILYLFTIKICRKKVVWFLHNKKPHTRSHYRLKMFLMRMMAKWSDLIITHAKEGEELIARKYPFAAKKTKFLDHPTKNRMMLLSDGKENDTENTAFDLLLWGKITPYKQIPEFLRFAKERRMDAKVKIVGTCSSDELYTKLVEEKTDNVDIENRDISFEELSRYVSDSHFVLVPYASDTVLSSAILMDSLSYGAKVIGPDVGSFKDYANSSFLKVYTFTHFDEIPSIVSAHRTDNIVKKDYIRFLDENNWSNFIRRLDDLLHIKGI